MPEMQKKHENKAIYSRSNHSVPFFIPTKIRHKRVSCHWMWTPATPLGQERWQIYWHRCKLTNICLSFQNLIGDKVWDCSHVKFYLYMYSSPSFERSSTFIRSLVLPLQCYLTSIETTCSMWPLLDLPKGWSLKGGTTVYRENQVPFKNNSYYLYTKWCATISMNMI